MGWVSLLEDSIKRFEADLHRLKIDAERDVAPASVEEIRGVRETISRGEAVLFEALKHLELATDPSVEMAALIREVEAQRDSHKSRLWEFQKTSESLARALNKERERANKLENALSELRIEYNRLEKRLEKVMRDDPNALYAAFMKGAAPKAKD